MRGGLTKQTWMRATCRPHGAWLRPETCAILDERLHGKYQGIYMVHASSQPPWGSCKTKGASSCCELMKALFGCPDHRVSQWHQPLPPQHQQGLAGEKQAEWLQLDAVPWMGWAACCVTAALIPCIRACCCHSHEPPCHLLPVMDEGDWCTPAKVEESAAAQQAACTFALIAELAVLKCS